MYLVTIIYKNDDIREYTFYNFCRALKAMREPGYTRIKWEIRRVSDNVLLANN